MINTLDDALTFLTSHHHQTYRRDELDAYLKAYPLTFDRKSIHITGSNGKGSTTAFLASSYAAQGYLVGVFTSPGMNGLQSMIVINGESIPDQEVVDYVREHEAVFSQFSLSEFEMVTLMAFHYFQQQRVDVAIIEVGMGGKLDATNIFTPSASVITNISLEHVDVLGPTLAHIAHHKMGIIKPKVPVMIGSMDEVMTQMIVDYAVDIDAPIFRVKAYSMNIIGQLNYPNTPPLSLGLKGSYQGANAALSVEVIDGLSSLLPVANEALVQGFAQASIIGRFEVIAQYPTVILDCAHNPDGAMKLSDAMRVYQSHPIGMMCAVFKDKNIEEMMVHFKKITHLIVLTSFQHPRARRDFSMFEDAYPFFEDVKDAFNHLRQRVGENGVILITGSVAFISWIRPILLEEKR